MKGTLPLVPHGTSQERFGKARVANPSNAQELAQQSSAVAFRRHQQTKRQRVFPPTFRLRDRPLLASVRRLHQSASANASGLILLTLGLRLSPPCPPRALQPWLTVARPARRKHTPMLNHGKLTQRVRQLLRLSASGPTSLSLGSPTSSVRQPPTHQD